MEYKAIKPSELRVGDIITAQWTPPEGDGPSELFTEVVVTKLEPNQVWAGYLGFLTYCNIFYLIERPKKPLPTAIGSVVEVDGVKYVRVIEDSVWLYEWAKSVEVYHFDPVSSEWLAERDYTVV